MPRLKPTLIQIPSIETRRTILRAHRAEDFDIYADMWADPAVTRFIRKTGSREESWHRFLRHAGMWRMMGYGYWAVEERSTGKFVGEAGFQDAKRAMTPSMEGVPEAGWVLSPAVQGRGLATEIVEAMVAWADRVLKDESTMCIIDPGNAASLKVARKFGYDEAGRTELAGSPIIVLRRRRLRDRG